MGAIHAISIPLSLDKLYKSFNLALKRVNMCGINFEVDNDMLDLQC